LATDTKQRKRPQNQGKGGGKRRDKVAVGVGSQGHTKKVAKHKGSVKGVPRRGEKEKGLKEKKGGNPKVYYILKETKGNKKNLPLHIKPKRGGENKDISGKNHSKKKKKKLK